MPRTQIKSHGKTSRLVVDIHRASDAIEVVHSHANFVEQLRRHDDVRVHDDKCAPVPGNSGGPIVAIVVDHYDVRFDIGTNAQVRRGRLERIQGRREIGLFVEGGDDYREFHGCSARRAVTAGESVWSEAIQQVKLERNGDTWCTKNM